MLPTDYYSAKSQMKRVYKTKKVQNRLAKPAQHCVPVPTKASGQAVRAFALTFGAQPQEADSASGGFLRHIVLMLLQEACTELPG